MMSVCPNAVVFTCAFCFASFVIISGFNLDTTIPVIKSGPSNSFFGFSVAQHQQLRRINKLMVSDEVVGNYFIVGAPRLNINGASENYTGGVYKCNALSMREDDCELLLTNVYDPKATADKGRNDQWLGVTVRSGGKGGQVVACAHRYKVTDNNFGLGNCYQLSQEMEYDEDIGVGKISPCKGYSVVKEHEEYAYCQAGTSAYITEDQHLVMGAPGAINWRGLLAEIDIAPALFGPNRILLSPVTQADPVPPPVPPISYLGYSVVGGRFDNTNLTYYVAGAPRSRIFGQVIFFSEMSSGSTLKYEQNQILTGALSFSGFGQDLIAVDINNDGYDDLIVGCPLYFNETDNIIRLGGAVYVYSGHGSMITNFTVPQIIVGRSMSQDNCDALQCLHGRFGFSLSKAGDLNRDGYQDFAIGAPYEGKGAIYLYHGSKDGVQEPFSQRIYAEDVTGAEGWATFGYSLSGGLDLDSNAYPDLLVGSYDTDKVALLRTRPIINLYSKVTVKPNLLNMSSDVQKTCQHDGKRWYCMEIKLCLRYTAEPVETFDDTINIIYTIIAEPKKNSPRVEFMTPEGASHVVEDQFQLLDQKTTGLSSEDTQTTRHSCVVQTAFLKDQITDVLTGLEFGISYRLPEAPRPIPTPSPGALPNINEYPILNANLTVAETMVISKVEFAKMCGDNGICESNLHLDASVNLEFNSEGVGILEIGRYKKMAVKVKIDNLGEIAYQAAFYLKIPPSLEYESSEPNTKGCSPSPLNSTLVECKDIGSEELGKPLKADASTQFTIYFKVNEDKMSTVRNIELIAFVNTTSKEQVPLDDQVKIPILVYVNADVEVSGKAEPDSSILYSGVVRGESAMRNEHMIGQAVNHTFSVFNNGNGSVQSSELTILWPYELASRYKHGKHLLYLMQPPQVLHGPAFCIFKPEIINVALIPEATLNIQPKQTYDVDPAYTIVVDDTIKPVEKEADNSTSREKRQAEADTDDDEPNTLTAPPKAGEARERKNAVILDCGRKTAKCHTIRCKIGLLGKGEYAKILVRARLWESTLLEDFREVDEVRIRSTGKLYIRPELNVVQISTDNDIGYAETIAIPSLQIVAEKSLAWWIIALAVLGGILLLIILALCLWKCGFFKRQRYDDATTYNVKVQKKKDIQDQTFSSKVETQKDYPDENEFFLKNH